MDYEDEAFKSKIQTFEYGVKQILYQELEKGNIDFLGRDVNRVHFLYHNDNSGYTIQDDILSQLSDGVKRRIENLWNHGVDF